MNSCNMHLVPGQSILGLPILITHYEVIHFENCSKGGILDKHMVLKLCKTEQPENCKNMVLDLLNVLFYSTLTCH